MDIAHSCGRTRVATASLSTFRPIASCTDRVAICQILHRFLLSGEGDPKRTVTAGSLVRIFERRGTSFCVRLVWTIISRAVDAR
jgi:hypothetical protein